MGWYGPAREAAVKAGDVEEVASTMLQLVQAGPQESGADRARVLLQKLVDAGVSAKPARNRPLFVDTAAALAALCGLGLPHPTGAA